jgi:amidase
MSELTSLTLAEQLAGLRKRAFSAVELADAHFAAAEQARALNAYVLETPERAREMAARADAALARGEGGPLAGIPLGVKDMFCTEGVRTAACSRILQNFVPPYESTVTANLWRDGAVMLGKLSNDEFAMGSSNESSQCGPVVSPARLGREDRPGWFVGRLGCRGGGRALPRRARHRHRRLDPPACGVYRHRRHQADLRPLLALGHHRLCLLARSGRAVRTHRARLRDFAALDGRFRS